MWNEHGAGDMGSLAELGERVMVLRKRAYTVQALVDLLGAGRQRVAGREDLVTDKQRAAYDRRREGGFWRRRAKEMDRRNQAGRFANGLCQAAARFEEHHPHGAKYWGPYHRRVAAVWLFKPRRVSRFEIAYWWSTEPGTKGVEQRILAACFLSAMAEAGDV